MLIDAEEWSLECLDGWLRAARQRVFVGRKAELADFEEAWGGEAGVLFVHGPGGIGKTALLERFALRAARADRQVLMLDGRTLDPSPTAFLAEIGPIFADGGSVLLIDAFEHVQGLERWLRERFLPMLPAESLVVVAGRQAPDLMWRADPAWTDRLRIVRLGDLEPMDATALLAARGVTAELHDPLRTFAGGHPLALSLAAGSATENGTAGSRWSPSPQLVTALLDHIVGDLPGPKHRRALEACAYTGLATQSLLRAVLPDDEAAALFAWLRRLPYVESSPFGVCLHDVVRRALEADLRWRDPQGYADLRRDLKAHLAQQIRAAEDPDVLGAVGSLLHLRSSGGHSSPPPWWHGMSEISEDVLRPSDVEDLLRLATDWGASAAAVSEWADRQPQAFRLYRRTVDGELLGVGAWLRVDSPGSAPADPMLAAAWAHTRAHGPLRPGEHLAIYRSWVRDDPEGRSPVTALVRWRAVAWFLRSQRLAWSFVARPAADPASVHPEYAGLHDRGAHVWEANVEYRLLAHDWRAVPAPVWLERLLSVDVLGDPGPDLVVLSRDEFSDAVRKALRHLSNHRELAANPLVCTRLLADRPDPVRALRDVLEESIQELGRDPRASKPHRALDVTYLRDAPTQEAAAERLGLSFTTYRRHLAAGIERVCDDLWRREIEGLG